MLKETIIYWVSHYGYGMIFSLLVFGIVGAPIPDETSLTFIGYLISKGDLYAFPSFKHYARDIKTGINLFNLRLPALRFGFFLNSFFYVENGIFS